MVVVFRNFEESDLTQFRDWFLDRELSRRLDFPTDEWFSHVTARGAHCWVAMDGIKSVAVLQVDQGEDGRGYLDIAVHPAFRGRGVGTTVLSAFVTGPGGAYPMLEGRIEPENVASIACCRKSGFKLLPGLDTDGFIRAIYRAS